MNCIDFEIKGVTYKLGKSGKEITIFPADANFPDRLEEAFSDIEKYTSNIKEGNTTEEKISISRDADKFVKSKLDYAFGYAVCDTVFGCVSSLSLNENGFYLFEQFVAAIMPVIEKEFGKRFDKLNKRVKSYTDKKGLHSAGRK